MTFLLLCPHAGRADDWNGGFAGDNKTANVTTYVSEVRITPFNEPRDLMYPSIQDQPDGCTPNYLSPYKSSPGVCHPVWTYIPHGLGTNDTANMRDLGLE